MSLTATTSELLDSSAHAVPLPMRNETVPTVARLQLSQSCYHELRSVSCEFHEGVLTLRGRVSGRYLKHVAQMLVRRINGVQEVDNRLKIDLPRCRE